MKRLFLAALSILAIGFSFAATKNGGAVDHFFVEIEPNPVKVNEASDLTIKAVDSEGNVVKDYDGNIVIEVQNSDGDQADDVTIPSDGIYEFASQDKGEKKFSKGLKFTTKGDYKLVISDVTNTDVKTVENVSVKDGESTDAVGSITVSSPIKGSTEKGPGVNVIGNSTLPNSPIEVYLNEKKATEGTTDENGDFNIIVNDVEKGENILSVKIVKLDGKPLAQSDDIDFTLDGEGTSQDSLYKGIEITPSTTINSGDKFTVNVSTAESVSSVQLQIGGMGEYAMEKSSSGKFTKELVASKSGKFDVNLKLTAEGNTKDVGKVSAFTVVEKKSVKNVKYFWDQKIQQDLNISWEYQGTISQFKFVYGTGPNEQDLTNQQIVQKNEVLLHNMDMTKTYYAKVYPLNTTGVVEGEASTIIEITPSHGSAPACMVKGIKLETIQENGKYYLVWSGAQGVDSYVIYKSESPTDNVGAMQKVGETKETRFEYPFDPKSKKDIYSYYIVEAKCTDGTTQRVDEMKKVKVGPMDTALVLILLGIFAYGSYKLYGYTKNN